jgi:hypothetical protein
LVRNLKAGVDDITFMINMLNTQLNPNNLLKNLLMIGRLLKRTWNYVNLYRMGLVKQVLLFLTRLANMEPVANVMGDLFNMKTAQAIVDDKINFIHTELESKYQNSDNSYDYVEKVVIKFMTGGNATNRNSLDGFTPEPINWY